MDAFDPSGGWARHTFQSWERPLTDQRLPYFFRVAALAYANHGVNGHARFKRGEVAALLATVDKVSGEIVPYRNVGRAIDDAVRSGYLEEGSFWGCLIVPAHDVKRGKLDDPGKPCPIHIRRARNARTTHPMSDSTFEINPP